MKNKRIKVEISARHIHLSQKDFFVLFGDAAKLEVRNYLSQPGEYASEQTVEVVGPEFSYEEVRVLGPFRDQTQLEISRTDSFILGIEAPYKMSGDLPGARIRVIGPVGEIVKNIAIIAKRHIHLSDIQAKEMRLKNGNHLRISIGGERGVTFDRVEVRINKNYDKVCHLDTDDGNAAGINKETIGTIIK